MQLRPRFAFTLLLPLLLLACAKEKETKVEVAIPQAVERTENPTWGLPFEFKPINNAAEKFREAGRATAMVRFAEGRPATGFFVLADGLFLTNEHVTPRACSRHRCVGVQLIRDFRVGGDMEVFNEFELLANSEELDFSLLRVKLAPGKKVPFLKVSDKVSENDELSILGYPGGGSLHLSASKLRYEDLVSSEFLSVTVGGNSGSPILKNQGLEVVAIHNASSRRDQEITRQGVAYGYGKGVLISSVLKALREAYPNFSLEAGPGAPNTNGSAKARNILPLEASPKLTETSFFRYYYQGPEETSRLHEHLEALKGKIGEVDELDSFLRSLWQLDSFRSKQSKLPASMNYVPNFARVYYRAWPAAECTKEISASRLPSFQLNESVVHCLSPTVNGQDPMAMIKEIYEGNLDLKWGASFSTTNSRLLRVLSTECLKRPAPLTEAERALALKVVKKIAEEAGTMRLYFRADGAFTLLKEKPELLQPGAFGSGPASP